MSDIAKALRDLNAAQMVILSKALRRTLDPWEEDNMPVGPSTRVRKQYIRCLSLTALPIIQLQYVKGIPSRRDPNGWRLLLPNESGDEPFLRGKKSDTEALKWADEHLRNEDWIFEG
jgi:hypothetical protein